MRWAMVDYGWEPTCLFSADVSTVKAAEILAHTM
jgi:hypothetical protein